MMDKAITALGSTSFDEVTNGALDLVRKARDIIMTVLNEEGDTLVEK
jgi:phosphopantetheine adenylyltransferase